MSEPTLRAQIDAANAYESLFVPAVFGQWAAKVADASIRIMVEADLRGWLPVMGVLTTDEQIGRILEEAERALGPYADPDGRVRFDLSAHLVTARKPEHATASGAGSKHRG